MIPEPRFAQVMEVAADTVVSPGDVLTVTTSLRVGRRRDREIEVDLNLPDTLPPGVYQLEAGSAASLPDVSGGSDPFFGFGPGPGAGGEESLEDAFARLNEADGNVQLKARVTYAMPLPVEAPPEGETPPDSGGLGFDSFFGLDPGPPPTASVQEEVDLYLAGTASLEIKVVAE